MAAQAGLMRCGRLEEEMGATKYADILKCIHGQTSKRLDGYFNFGRFHRAILNVMMRAGWNDSIALLQQ